MYLLERVLMLLSETTQLVVYGIDCPLDWKSTLIVSLTFSQTRHWAEQKKGAFKTHLNFVSLCKSSLLIGVLFFLRLLARCPLSSRSLFFFHPTPNPPPYVSIVVFVRRECIHSRLEEKQKKNFRKTNCWKKKKWYREKKECTQPPRWSWRKKMLKEGKNHRRRRIYRRWIHKHF